MERLSAARIRHRRLSRRLVRGVARTQPVDRIRPVCPPRGGISLLARTRPAGRMRRLGDLAGTARGGAWHWAVAIGHRYCRPLAPHRTVCAHQHAADGHFCRACGPCASPSALSSLGIGAHRAIWAFLAYAFAAATHSATLAVLLALLILYVPVLLLSGLRYPDCSPSAVPLRLERQCCSPPTLPYR